MPYRTALLGSALFLTLATPASAREIACHFEAGVLVVPARVVGIAGDYILDTGTVRTALHETKAGAEGLEGAETVGAVELAGETSPPAPIAIADLDVRTWNLPTPGLGVIGADAMQGFVVDVSFAPCRVRFSRPGRAPAFRGKALPVAWDAGRPVAAAEASDGVRTLRGPFLLATGANAPVRLAEDIARASGADSPAGFRPDGVWLARLATLTFSGRTDIDLGAGLTPPEGELAGVLGGPVLANFRLRFDFPRGRVLIAPR